MLNSDHTPAAPRPPAPPADGMTWGWLAWQMRLHGPNFMPPPHLRTLPLPYVEGKAREEQEAERAAEAARKDAARSAREAKPADRPDSAPVAVSIAAPDMQAAPARRPARSAGWRLRSRYLVHLRRSSSFREAAARTGIDESTARRWREKNPKFGAQCAGIVAGRHAELSDDLKLRAGSPRVRPHFHRGRQVGEQVVHDDRALMFLLKLEDGQRARAEAREERRLEREHEIRLKEMEIAARREARRETRPPRSSVSLPSPDLARRLAAAEARLARRDQERAAGRVSGMHASVAQAPSLAVDGSARESNGLAADPADTGPPRIVEVPGRAV